MFWIDRQGNRQLQHVTRFQALEPFRQFRESGNRVNECCENLHDGRTCVQNERRRLMAYSKTGPLHLRNWSDWTE